LVTFNISVDFFLPLGRLKCDVLYDFTRQEYG
jgi:hypothetical protein